MADPGANVAWTPGDDDTKAVGKSGVGVHGGERWGGRRSAKRSGWAQ